jgi:hypothetical protein
MAETMVTVTADLEDFVQGHRLHGRPKANTGLLPPNGCRLAVACSCGVTFERWITPQETARDLTLLARLS